MDYKFTPSEENYEMYASGGILAAAPGHTAFPVRLANEIFRRCMAFREAQGTTSRCILYDPCCGSAYHLTTLAYFNWSRIERIIGADMDEDALSLATRNLALLTPQGLDKRIQELAAMVEQFAKPSHSTALQNALNLKQKLLKLIDDHSIETQMFRADATDAQTMLAQPADVVFTDIPYGQHSHWHSDTQALATTHDPVHQLLEALLPKLQSNAVVAVAASKKDKIRHERYRRLDKFNVGKRQIVILQPISA